MLLPGGVCGRLQISTQEAMCWHGPLLVKWTSNLTLLFIQSSSFSSPVAMSNTQACTLGVAKPSLQRRKYRGVRV